MQRISNYVRLQGSGTPVANASVDVFDVGTLIHSTIHSDDGITLKANPFTADANGFWFFYAANGVYDVRFSGGTIPTPFTWGAISVFDAVLLIPENGSAGAPSHSFRNALTTGMWWDSTNSLLRWAFGGANRLWLSNTALTVDTDFNPNTPDTYKAGSASLRWLEGWINTVFFLQGNRITSGTGSPEGVLAAAKGSLYLRIDGGTGTGFYVKETGGTTVDGWVAK